MSQTNTTIAGLNLPSFKQLLENLGDEKKMAAAKQATLLIKKEAKISSLVKTAKIAQIEATDRLNDALLSESADEAQAVKAVIDATKTLEFYEAIYTALFPNA